MFPRADLAGTSAGTPDGNVS